jgi:hypothetical protein
MKEATTTTLIRSLALHRSYSSIQKTDPGTMTTATNELHHCSVVREVENYLDPQLHIHFKDDPLV